MFFERFSLLFHGFWGFGRYKNLCFLWFSFSKKKKQRKGRTGFTPTLTLAFPLRPLFFPLLSRGVQSPAFAAFEFFGALGAVG